MSKQNLRHLNSKIVLLGGPAVGKTALAYSLGGRDFDTNTSVTRGIRINPLMDDTNKEVSIFDAGGQESEREARHKFIAEENPSIVLVAFNPRTESLREYLSQWLPTIPYVPQKLFLVATQSDQFPVSSKDFAEIGKQYSFDDTFITSAATNAGIQELRTSILKAVREIESELKLEQTIVGLAVRKMAECLCELIAMRSSALDEIEWRDLERIIATALEQIGFTVELTPPAKDGGKDVIASCVIENAVKRFYVEIKHWRKGDKPGSSHVSDFVEINVRDRTDGGLFLSSSGYTNAIYRQLGEISSQRVRLGEREKILSLCQHYVMKKKGLWSPVTPLPELLFEQTLN